MSNKKSQAISGVSAGSENQMMTKWPSIAAFGAGRLIGQFMSSIPTRLVLWLPLALVGAVLYFIQKLTGERFTITNKSVQRWTGLGGRMIQRIELSDIVTMEVKQQSGQEFFCASDLLLMNAKGDVAMRLDGLPHAEIFLETITKARQASMQVQESLKTIGARH
ncbi:MAG: hypothetical protein ACKV2Q_03480 [Planctomycetaceae bacterium]